MMKIFQLAAAAVIATSTSAQDPITCSCTPNSYSFSLNFDGICDGSFGSISDGIDGSICFFTQGGDPANLDAGMTIPPTRRRRLGNAAVEKNEEWVDTVLSKVDFTNHIQHAAAAHATRQLQSFDTTPTIITSVTFLEVEADTSELNIINQDSTYFETTLSDGDVITYPSISAQLDVNMSIGDQLDKVPGGVILVLFGENAAGEVIQNDVAWGYVGNNCIDEPLAVGSSIGWISLDGYDSPYPEFCDAGTAPPSRSPSKAPSVAPSTKSKSGKETTKSSKTEKMSMPSYAKSKKGDTKSSKLMAAVSHLAVISDEMEMTMNESSSVIEALATLTSSENSDKSTDEDI